MGLSEETMAVLMGEALKMATRSPDPSTQNAALLVKWDGKIVARGINEFPDGVLYTPERWERPLKYQYIEHAERNSIYDAAAYGETTFQRIMVCPWAACADCGRAIIQAEIAELVTLKPHDADTNERWDDSTAVAMTMFKESGLKVTFLTGEQVRKYVPSPAKVLRSGVLWEV